MAQPSMIFKPDNLERDVGLEQDFSWQSFVYLTLQGHYWGNHQKKCGNREVLGKRFRSFGEAVEPCRK